MSDWKLPRFGAASPDLVSLVLRLTLGGVFFPHGAQKALGWFGGPGILGEIHALHTHLGIPAPLVLCAIAAEFLGALGLLTGLLTRLSAFGILTVMTVAIAMEHWQNGFFMNWFGNQKGEGFEYHLLVIGLAVAILMRGAGAYSLDALAASRRAS